MSPNSRPEALRDASRTCLLTAAMRAAETRRPDRLYADPYAKALAGREGAALLRAVRACYERNSGVPSVSGFNAIRTRYFDEYLLGAARSGVQQVVIGASGMDTRAHRLEWPEGVCVFELDHSEVLAVKAKVLGGLDSRPRCTHHLIGADLTDERWPEHLIDAGYRPGRPAAWLLEGLLQYLPATAVHILIGQIAGLTGPGATLAANVIGRTALHAPVLQPLLALFEEWGAPWLFGVDDPAQPLREHGFEATVIRPGEAQAHFGRWTDADSTAAQVVRLFFVVGTRQRTTVKRRRRSPVGQS